MPLFFFMHSSLRPWEGAPWYFVSATVPSAVCLICSVIYHTFMAGSSSKESYRRLLFVDYLSVFNTMVWPEAMVIGWSFVCHPILQYAALSGARFARTLRIAALEPFVSLFDCCLWCLFSRVFLSLRCDAVPGNPHQYRFRTSDLIRRFHCTQGILTTFF